MTYSCDCNGYKMFSYAQGGTPWKQTPRRRLQSSLVWLFSESLLSWWWAAFGLRSWSCDSRRHYVLLRRQRDVEWGTSPGELVLQPLWVMARLSFPWIAQLLQEAPPSPHRHRRGWFPVRSSLQLLGTENTTTIPAIRGFIRREGQR